MQTTAKEHRKFIALVQWAVSYLIKKVITSTLSRSIQWQEKTFFRNPTPKGLTWFWQEIVK